MPYAARPRIVEKQHTCVGCGCVFRYAMNANDWTVILSSRTGKGRDGVKIHPCPECGVIQPEMVKMTKLWHLYALGIALVLLLILAVVGMVNSGAHALLAAQIGVGAFLTLALIHLLTAWTDPNGDLQANLAQAKEEIADRRLESIAPGDAEAAHQGKVPSNLSLGYVVPLLLVFAAPVTFMLTMGSLSSQQALPRNEHVHPAVTAVGDEVTFTFSKVRSEGVTGAIWRGQPSIRVLNARALGLPETLPGQGSNQQWGETIRVPRSGSKNQPIRARVKFTIPNREQLVGQTLRLSVTMPITFPVVTSCCGGAGKRYFEDRTATLSENLVVKLVDRQQREEAQRAFLLGLSGAGLSLLGAIWLTILAWSFGWKPSASEVLTDEQMDPAAASAEDEEETPLAYRLARRGNLSALEEAARSLWRDKRWTRESR